MQKEKLLIRHVCQTHCEMIIVSSVSCFAWYTTMPFKGYLSQHDPGFVIKLYCRIPGQFSPLKITRYIKQRKRKALLSVRPLSLSLPDCFGTGPYSHCEPSQSLFGKAVNSVSTTGCLQLRLCMFPHLSQRDRNLMYIAESIARPSGHVWSHRG